MVISSSVREQFFGSSSTSSSHRVIRVESSQTSSLDEATMIERRIGLPWTKAEHERFLQGLELYPSGPWKLVADYVGTRTTRQTMTHAQKYRQKIGRQHHRQRVITKSNTKTEKPTQPAPREGKRHRTDANLSMPKRDGLQRSRVDAQFDEVWAQALPSPAFPLSPTPVGAPPAPLSRDDSHALLSLFQEPAHSRTPTMYETRSVGYHGHAWTMLYSPMQPGPDQHSVV